MVDPDQLASSEDQDLQFTEVGIEKKYAHSGESSILQFRKFSRGFYFRETSCCRVS